MSIEKVSITIIDASAAGTHPSGKAAALVEFTYNEDTKRSHKQGKCTSRQMLPSQGTSTVRRALFPGVSGDGLPKEVTCELMPKVCQESIHEVSGSRHSSSNPRVQGY